MTRGRNRYRAHGIDVFDSDTDSDPDPDRLGKWGTEVNSFRRQKMKTTRKQTLLDVAPFCAVSFTATVVRALTLLPSRDDGKTRQSISDFVAKMTKPGSPVFVPVAERIAAFGNDDALRCEKSMAFQLCFARDCVTGPAPQHPVASKRGISL